MDGRKKKRTEGERRRGGRRGKGCGPQIQLLDPPVLKHEITTLVDLKTTVFSKNSLIYLKKSLLTDLNSILNFICLVFLSLNFPQYDLLCGPPP